MPFLYTRYDICPPSQEQEQGQDSYGHCMDDLDSKPPTTIQIVTFWLIFGMIGSIILITLGIMVPPYLRIMTRSCLGVFRGKEEEKGEKGNFNSDSGGSVSGLAHSVAAKVDIGKPMANTGDGGDHGAVCCFVYLSPLFCIFFRYSLASTSTRWTRFVILFRGCIRASLVVSERRVKARKRRKSKSSVLLDPIRLSSKRWTMMTVTEERSRLLNSFVFSFQHLSLFLLTFKNASIRRLDLESPSIRSTLLFAARPT